MRLASAKAADILAARDTDVSGTVVTSCKICETTSSRNFRLTALQLRPAQAEDSLAGDTIALDRNSAMLSIAKRRMARNRH